MADEKTYMRREEKKRKYCLNNKLVGVAECSRAQYAAIFFHASYSAHYIHYFNTNGKNITKINKRICLRVSNLLDTHVYS